MTDRPARRSSAAVPPLGALGPSSRPAKRASPAGIKASCMSPCTRRSGMRRPLPPHSYFYAWMASQVLGDKGGDNALQLVMLAPDCGELLVDRSRAPANRRAAKGRAHQHGRAKAIRPCQHPCPPTGKPKSWPRPRARDTPPCRRWCAGSPSRRARCPGRTPRRTCRARPAGTPRCLHRCGACSCAAARRSCARRRDVVPADVEAPDQVGQRAAAVRGDELQVRIRSKKPS